MQNNFPRMNLRGLSFKNQDLTGSDFSYADIRGCDFTNANLTNTNFRGCKAGLQTPQAVLLIILFLMFSTICGISFGFGGFLLLPLLDLKAIREYLLLATGIFNIVVVAFFLVIYKAYKINREVKRLTGQAESQDSAIAVPTSLILSVTTVVFLTMAGIFLLQGYFTIAVALMINGIIFFIIALLLALAMAGIVSIAGPLAVFLALFGSVTCIASFLRVLVINRILTTNLSLFLLLIAATFIALLSLYISFQSIAGKYKFSWFRMIAVNYSSLGGTSFRRANLTNANFTDAVLANTDFRQAISRYTCWLRARKLNQARLDDTVLFNKVIQDLLVSGIGSGKSYYDMDLSYLNLRGSDLSNADMRKIDLTQADLFGSNLEGVNLAYALVKGTNFSEARMTGACLDSWITDKRTNLNHVDCRFVYLRSSDSTSSYHERYPIEGEFAPDEFTTIFRNISSTIELIFRSNFDWRSLNYSIEKLQVESGTTELRIQGIEHKGDGIIVVKVEVPTDLDKKDIYNRLTETYEEASKYLNTSTTSKALSSSLEEYVDLVVIKALNNLSVAYDEALAQRNFTEATNLANSAYEMCQTIVDRLDSIQDRELYLRVISLSSYWKLNRELYRGFIEDAD